jgi:hypothetical protein
MAILYWLRLAEHTDVFNQGYIGVAQDFKKRLRSHKHRFKSIWKSIIATPLVVGSKDYCFDVEKKLRPNRQIGWNRSAGGYRNNAMNGDSNPNFGKTGQNASRFIGWYVTPLGRFERPEDAAKAHGCDKMTIYRRCKGRIVNAKFLPPQSGYAFEQKGGIKP